jgi:hypothetical protein
MSVTTLMVVIVLVCRDEVSTSETAAEVSIGSYADAARFEGHRPIAG